MIKRRAAVAAIALLLLVTVLSVTYAKAKHAILAFPDKDGTVLVYRELNDPSLPDGRWTLSVSHVEIAGETYIVQTVDRDGLPYRQFLKLRDGKLLFVGSSWGDEDVSWLDEPHAQVTRLRVGQAWSDGDLQYKVVGRQTVTVEAGTFKTLAVEVTYPGYYMETAYYADGIGLVKQVGMNARELISFTPGK